MKYTYYVGVFESLDNKLRFVTRVDNTTKTAKWTDGMQARPFRLHEAEDLVYGLTCNGFRAVVIKAPDFHRYVNVAEVEA